MESKVTESKFFTFVRPYLAFIDSPRIFTQVFSWLYNIFALGFLLLPFCVLYKMIDEHFFKWPVKYIAAGILTWVVILAASFIAFQVWWNRKKEIKTEKITAAVVIDAFSELIHTSLEASGTWIGITGVFAGIFALIFKGGLLDLFGFNSSISAIIIVVSAAGGYFTVLLSKFIAFLFHKIADIIVYATVRMFHFAVHVVKQLFEFVFIYWQSLVDFTVNGWRVVIALVAKLGNYLLAFARSKKTETSDSATITYNT